MFQGCSVTSAGLGDCSFFPGFHLPFSHHWSLPEKLLTGMLLFPPQARSPVTEGWQEGHWFLRALSEGWYPAPASVAQCSWLLGVSKAVQLLFCTNMHSWRVSSPYSGGWKTERKALGILACRLLCPQWSLIGGQARELPVPFLESINQFISHPCDLNTSEGSTLSLKDIDSQRTHIQGSF